MTSPSHGGAPMPVGDEITIWSFVNVLLRHARIVVGVPLAGAIVAAALALSTAREYTASASFQPQERETTSGLSALAMQYGFNLPRTGNGSSWEFYSDLLQSRGILRAVVTTRYGDSGTSAFKGDLLHYFGITTPDRDAAIAAAERRLLAILDVRSKRSTSMVTIEVHTLYPDLSVGIVERFLDLLNDFNLQRRQSQARAEREFVEQRLTDVQGELRAAEEAVSGFLRRNRSYLDSPELVAERARLDRQVALQQQLYLSLRQSFEAARIEEVRNTPVITIIERPEGMVERRPRQTVLKVAAAAFLGAFVAIPLAFLSELLGRAREERYEEYEEAVQRWRGLLSAIGVRRR